MSTAFTGLTSKAADNHANADQEETIDFKDMPVNLRARYALKKHPVDLICRSDLALYSNVLITNMHGVVQQWRTVGRISQERTRKYYQTRWANLLYVLTTLYYHVDVFILQARRPKYESFSLQRVFWLTCK